jgi:sec-independent protein translocase protein TatA
MMPGMQETIIVLIIILIIFGAGKLPKVMGDLGKGMKSFKKAMSEDDSAKVDDAEASDKPDSENKK